jgi:hypothetical protein
MISQDVDIHEIVTFADLNPLAMASGPCLTAVITLNNPSVIAASVKNTMHASEEAGGARDRSRLANMRVRTAHPLIPGPSPKPPSKGAYWTF